MILLQIHRCPAHLPMHRQTRFLSLYKNSCHRSNSYCFLLSDKAHIVFFCLLFLTCCSTLALILFLIISITACDDSFANSPLPSPSANAQTNSFSVSV